MTNLEELLEQAKAGRLEHGNLERVSAMLQEGGAGADPYTLLHIIGRSGDRSRRALVEKYLHWPQDPMLARLALQIVCGYWGDIERYLDQVLEFVKGVDWDDENDVRQVAISNAGEYLRTQSHTELLQRLLDIVRDGNESPTIRADAYFALSRAVGRDWKDLPNAAHVFDVEKEADPTILQEALRRLGPGS
jgi:hypothetical protein